MTNGTGRKSGAITQKLKRLQTENTKLRKLVEAQTFLLEGLKGGGARNENAESTAEGPYARPGG